MKIATKPLLQAKLILSILIAATSQSLVAQDRYPLQPSGQEIEGIVDSGSPRSNSSESHLSSVESDASSGTAESATKAESQNPKKEKEPAGCKTCCHGTLVDWSLYPATIRPMPRPGIFPIPPSAGPAYFSVFDALTGNCQENRPKSGYAPFAINAWPFFDADWRFVESIPCQDRNIVERMKRIHLNDCWLLDTGGQSWIKYHHEHNSRLTNVENDFTLLNFRLYADLWYRDNLRIYGEYVWADSNGEALPPVPPDVDRGDIQNLFIDLKLFELADKPVYVRTGRQELLYGSQRMITPLPWANKRNTFQGVKLFRQGEKWDYDLFWTQFVPPDANEFDRVDDNQNLVGSWLTYRPKKGNAVDLYYLLYDNSNNVTQQNIVRYPANTNTFGSRWSGDKDGQLWDFEGALQFGDVGNNDLFAGMATAGLGRHWKDACWKPTAWLYYDFASGDADPNVGTDNTFNQLFPFGHYYLGWMDLVGRQNIHDVNAHLYVYPTAWCTVWLQYHHFWLAQSQDALYNAGGAAYRRDPTGQAGNNVGDEIDLVMNFHTGQYSDVLLSYNQFFGGRFVEQTTGANQTSDAQTLYLIFQQRW